MTFKTLNSKEAAALMKVHPETLMELTRMGALPAAKIGRSWVFRESDVVAFVEAQIDHQTRMRMVAPLDSTPRGGRIPGRRGPNASPRSR